MNIQEFISNYHNHPVLFVGTGLSLRYLKNSYSWDSLLQKVAMDFNENPEYYLDIKSEHMDSTGYVYEQIATQLENDFNQYLKRIVMENSNILMISFMKICKRVSILVDLNCI